MSVPGGRVQATAIPRLSTFATTPVTFGGGVSSTTVRVNVTLVEFWCPSVAVQVMDAEPSANREFGAGLQATPMSPSTASCAPGTGYATLVLFRPLILTVRSAGF